jgi:hypothetical protein
VSRQRETADVARARDPVNAAPHRGDSALGVLTARGAWLRLERARDPEQVTSTMQVLDVLDELSSSLLLHGSVLASLSDNGVLDRSHTGAAPTIEQPIYDGDTEVRDNPVEQS